MADGTADIRPDSQLKRQAIIEAATKVFLGVGYGDASMDQIAAEAGVSKQTVYSHFGGKEQLFEAIVTGKCDDLVRTSDPVRALDHKLEDDPCVVLASLAKQFVLVVLSDESIRLYKTIIAESERFPGLAKAFYRSGPEKAYRSLAAYLDASSDRHGMLVADSRAAAEHFYAMLRDDLYMRRLMGLSDMPSAAEVDRHATDVATRFIAMYSIR